jgi:hypothetical protein
MKKADAPGRTISSRAVGVRAVAWSLSICALAAGLGFTVPGAAATAAVTRPASKSAYATFPGRLYSAAAVSANDAWAAGLGADSSLIVHWNGQQWTLVTGSTPGGDASLLSVTASWTNNIWAVGITNPTRCGNVGPQCQTLIEHWNGVRWKVIPSPNPPSAYLNVLWGISAISRTDIWAVGTTDYGSTLIVHWNGTSWS